MFLLRFVCESRLSCRGFAGNIFCSFPWHVHHTLSSLSSLSHSITTSIHHMYSSLSLFSPCSRSFFLYMSLFSRLQRSHVFCFLFFFSLVLHCVSVSGVTSVVLPYGRWHHAVLPQGRTTDGMLEGVCVHTSVHTTSFHKPQSRGGAGSAWLWWWSLWCYCWWALNLPNMHLFVCFVYFFFYHVYISFIVCVVKLFVRQKLVKWFVNLFNAAVGFLSTSFH